MMENTPENNNWAARLKDWEATEQLPESLMGDWDRLSATLDNQQKKKRGFVWFWWALPVLTLGLGIWIGKTVFAEGYPAVQAINSFPLFQSVGQPASNVEAGDELILVSLEEERKGNEEPVKTLLFNSDIATPDKLGFKELNSERKVGEPQGSSIAVKSNILVTPPTPKERIDLLELANTGLPFGTEGAQPISGNKLASINQLPPLKLPGLVYNTDHVFDLKPLVTIAKEITPINPPTWKVFIGPQVGLEKSVLNVELPEGTLRSQSFTNSLVKSGGVMARFERGKFGVETGLLRSQESSRYRYLILRTYVQRDEVPDALGGGKTTFDLEVAGNRSKVLSEIEVSRPQANQFARPQRLLINADLTETTATTSIPLQLSYDVSVTNKLVIRTAAGVAWNRQTVDTDLTARLLQRGDFILGRTRIVTRENLLKQTYWTGQLISGIVYRPTARFQFGVSLRYGYGLGKLADVEGATSDLSRFSLQVGGKYQLF